MVPLKQIEYGVYGDVTTIDPAEFSQGLGIRGRYWGSGIRE